MRRRHSALPKIWLMTDERMGDGLLPAIRRLPKGRAGIVWRHHATPPAERRRLFQSVRAIARCHRLMLILAGSPEQAMGWQADGWHGRRPRPGGSRLIHSMAVHDAAELRRAIRAGADLVFVSPVFPTRSHPGARTLGRSGFARLARAAPMPVIALGGMTEGGFRILQRFGAYGYAAIDAWLG